MTKGPLTIMSLIILICTAASAQTRSEFFPNIGRDDFRLPRHRARYTLVYTYEGKHRQVDVPNKWLQPHEGTEKEQGWDMPSFKYGPLVTSFEIGNGRIGIQLSSFQIQSERAQSGRAAGRDVFLVLNPATNTLDDGLTGLGITKGRTNMLGCRIAQCAAFTISDVNGDGMLDIGVRREQLQIECYRRNENGRDSMYASPYYWASPTCWYVYKDSVWKYESDFDARTGGADSWTLPLIGFHKSPVEFMMELLKTWK